MNFLKRLILSILFIVPYTLSYSQVMLKGKVFTPESQEGQNNVPGQYQGEVEYIPLPGATVIWKSGSAVNWEKSPSGTTTDAHGYFKIRAWNLGDTLQVSMVGYKTVGLVYSGQKYVEIPLNPGVELNAVEVEGRVASTSISLLDPLNIQQLNRKELSKAACCKLSDAFDTNASVDASFTDAITGTKQIRMLGLDGKYTQIMVDNLPGPRGLNVLKGLSFIPGPWIDGITISKGTGSVINGYESITGQINVAMRNPENAEPLHINLYGSSNGRFEWNHVSQHNIDRRWSTTILSHSEIGKRLNDRNGDSFLDIPLSRDFVIRNEWKYIGDRGIRGEYSISAVSLQQMAGQKGAFTNNTADPFVILEDLLANDNDSLWTAATKIKRVEASAKTGYVFPRQEWKSIGSQFFVSRHEHKHKFGNREYLGTENFFRGNVLFSSIIGSTDHKFTTGASILYDDFNEVGTWAASSSVWDAASDTMSRTEIVPGAFFEYTWTAGERLVSVAGLRTDFHNLYGTFVSPRLHVRYSLAEETSIKFVAGRGFRTANVMMEKLGTWASNRRWNFQQDLQPEIATNIGVNLVSKFKLNSRDASLSLDGYLTDFENRVVVDLYNSPNTVEIYNAGLSRSTTVQVEFDWSLHRRVDVRAAYRWVDARTDYLDWTIDDMRRDPFVSTHRAFTQWSYASKPKSKGQQFRVDGVLQWVGSQELPASAFDTSSDPIISPAFTQVNLQLSQSFKDDIELYVGMENILNVRQNNPIVGAIATIEGPELDPNFNEVFDASLVYGPIFGRLTYAGLRWTVGE